MCADNPFVLDHAALEGVHLPFSACPCDVPRLPRASDLETFVPAILEEIQVADNSIVCRVLDGDETRVLKLFTGNGASERFDAEAAAYARLLYHKSATNGGVLKCFGWVGVDARVIVSATTVSSRFREAIRARGTRIVKGILLEDLAGAQPLSIHNISLDMAERVLQSLHTVHAAYVLHGQLERHNVLVIPAESRAIWIGFSHASYDSSGGAAAFSSQSLLAEMAQAWKLVYQRLLPDSLIGWEAGPDAVDPDTLCGTPTTQPIAPIRPRPSDLNVEDTTRTLLLSYPEINVFSWDPPIHNLTPGPRHDHRYDTKEFLMACRVAVARNMFNPLHKWYACLPPTIILDPVAYKDDIIAPLTEYASPPPLRQLPSHTAITFLEHVSPSSSRALMKVRVSQEERLLKIFSCALLPRNADWVNPKALFETERDAYAHLVHYGACAAGAVPRCDGWLELSPTHVYDAIALVRRTREAGQFGEDEEPVWVFPIFNDGTFATALVLEYFPVKETISVRNMSPHRADLLVRSLSHVHGAYVVHGDFDDDRDALIVPGDELGSERVVIVDFDHSRTAAAKQVYRLSFLNELGGVWGKFYKRVLPLQRIYCEDADHPHGVVYRDEGVAASQTRPA